jgi:hypothetical protein
VGEEVDPDVRYYAARCLALAELKPDMEVIIVDSVRKKYPEFEDEVMMTLLRGCNRIARSPNNRLQRTVRCAVRY